MRANILEEIEAERKRQDLEWGGASHDDDHSSKDWMIFMMKHLGRAVTYEEPKFRSQMVIVAALAVAAIEWFDRLYNQEPDDE